MIYSSLLDGALLKLLSTNFGKCYLKGQTVNRSCRQVTGDMCLIQSFMKCTFHSVLEQVVLKGFDDWPFNDRLGQHCYFGVPGLTPWTVLRRRGFVRPRPSLKPKYLQCDHVLYSPAGLKSRTDWMESTKRDTLQTRAVGEAIKRVFAAQSRDRSGEFL